MDNPHALPIDAGAGLIQQLGMRQIVILGLSCALMVGCRHARPSDSKTAATEPAAKARADKKPGKESKKNGPTATPIVEPAGKVASVNPNLRFVVIDFALNPVPQVDQRLSVYRQGQKVGEVKISSQSRNSIIAADITQGEANVGDEVRP
jgi:hypothetical protein